MGVGELDVGLEARDYEVAFVEDIVDGEGLRLQTERSPQVGGIGPEKVWAHDADDAVRLLIELDGTANDVVVAAKSGFPGVVGEHDFVICAGLVFFGRENAAEHRAGFKDIEPLPTDARAAHAERKIATGVVEAAVILHGCGGENFLMVADIGEVRRGDHDTFEIKFFVARANGGETLGMRNAGGMEEQGVQRAEDGGVGADSET